MKETEVTMGGKDNLSGVTKVSNLSEVGPRPPEEDVDGIETARALRSPSIPCPVAAPRLQLKD